MTSRSPAQALRTCATLLVMSLCGSAWASPTWAQTVRGIVLEDQSRESIEGVRLILRDPEGVVRASALSGEAGRFLLVAETRGMVRLAVTHLGYAVWDTADFSLANDAVIDVEVRLGVEAIPLDPITVVARGSSRVGRLAGFEQRRSDPGHVGGYFLTEEDIERRPSATAATLVLGSPGMSTGSTGPGGSLDRRLIMARGCLSRMFIDGVRVDQTRGHSVDDLLSPELIAGVEMYPRGVSAPPQYQDNTRPDCGVVLFWTKDGAIGDSNGWGAKRIVVGVGLLVGLLTLGFIG